MKEKIFITSNLMFEMKILQIHQQLHSLLKKGQREKEVTTLIREKEVTTLIREKEVLTQSLLN